MNCFKNCFIFKWENWKKKYWKPNWIAAAKYINVKLICLIFGCFFNHFDMLENSSKSKKNYWIMHFSSCTFEKNCTYFCVNAPKKSIWADLFSIWMPRVLTLNAKTISNLKISVFIFCNDILLYFSLGIKYQNVLNISYQIPISNT